MGSGKSHTKSSMQGKMEFVNEFVFLKDAFLATGIFKFQLFENACMVRSYAFLNVLLPGCCCILQTTKYYRFTKSGILIFHEV